MRLLARTNGERRRVGDMHGLVCHSHRGACGAGCRCGGVCRGCPCREHRGQAHPPAVAAGAVSLLKMTRSDVPFVPTRHDDVVVSTNTVVFADGALPVGVESKMLLYVRNAGRSPTKVQFVAKERGDKFAVRTEPSVVTLSRGMACEFEVVLTSLCSCKVNDKALLVVRERGAAESTTIPLGVKARRNLQRRCTTTTSPARIISWRGALGLSSG